MRIDHVAQGMAQLRSRLARDPNTAKVLSVLLQQVQSLDNLCLMILSLWTLNTSRTPLPMLQQIGSLLKVPYDTSMTAEMYRRLLQLRIRSRKSEGTFDDVLDVANLLRTAGTVDQAKVQVIHPHSLQVEIPNVLLALKGLVHAILLDAIQETTQLHVTGVTDTEAGVQPQQYFTLSEDGPGFGSMLAPEL
jgi:hypothetical protein